MAHDCDALVIGAGISGLTAAFRLAQSGLRVQLVDAASRVGGVIGTESTGGFVCERGPNSILETNALIQDLLRDAGIAGERIEMNPACARRYVIRGGTLVPVPTSAMAFAATPLFSLKSKLRLLREPFVGRAPPGPDESIAQFVTRRLGREFLDYAIEPFVAGVYAGAPEALSLAAAFPKLHALEQRYGSLIRGQIVGALRRTPQGGSSGPIAASFSFRRGMQTLTDALARAGPVPRLALRVEAIRRQDSVGFEVALAGIGEVVRVSTRSIVLAVPAYAAAALVQPLCPDAAEALEAIPYAPIASIAHAYARVDVAHALDAFGFLVPRVEKRRILGALFSSSMFEGRAPAESVLITTFVGGQRDPQLVPCEDAELERITAAELEALLGVTGRPAFSAVTRWPRAIPQYTPGHLERLRRVKQAEESLPGLFFCGAYRGGVSVGDCIRSAHQTADQVRVMVSADCR